MVSTPAHPKIRTYGRRKGRGVSIERANNVNAEFDDIIIGDNIDKLSCGKEITLEIGMGDGTHALHIALSNPENFIYACEPYYNGVISTAKKIRNEQISNLKLYCGDARNFIKLLKPQSISTVYILFPDPWPKKRQHKRRLINQQFLNELHHIIKPEGTLRFATDIGDYAAQTLEAVMCDNKFIWTTNSADDFRNPWPNYIPTKYHLKALKEDRTPYFLEFRRNLAP